LKEFSLGGTERLKSHTALNTIFLKGKTIALKPFSIIYRLTELQTPSPVKAAFVVPSRNIREAAGRNRIKRLMREAYRKNKGKLYEAALEKSTGIELALKYSARTQPLKGETEEKIIVLLHRLTEKL
jgi:ribonuclease P protein component